MVIMIFMPEIFFGGAERQMRMLAEGLSEKNNQVIIVSEHSLKEEYSQDELAYKRNHKEIDFVDLKHLWMRKGRIKQIVSFFKMRSICKMLIKKYKPSIAIVYSSISIKSIPQIVKKKVKVIYCERNSADDRFLRLNMPFIKHATRITANSLYAVKQFKKVGLNSEWIPNGIKKVEKFEYSKKNTLNIFVPARIAPVKNQMIVIEAVSKIDNFNGNIVFAGKIEDDSYYEKLKEKTIEYGVSNKVNFCNYIDDVKEAYKDCDVVILPSFSEGLPNVVLESYMYGRYCIISDIQMNRDCAAPSQRFFSPNNATKLAEEILLFFNDNYNNIIKIIDENYAYVCDKYSEKNLVDNYAALIKSTIEE